MLVCVGAEVRKYCGPRDLLQKEYSLAKIGFDTAENEPSKVTEYVLTFAPPKISEFQRRTRGSLFAGQP